MPPNIPTSFVPRQPVQTSSVRGFSFNFQGLFLLLAFVLLGIALLSSAGVFVYEKYLEGQSETKATQLTQEEQNISQTTVEQFLQLQSRLTTAEGLLDRHVTLSSFFNLFESITLTHVRYTNLTIAVNDDQSAKLEADGQAATFNALAAESQAFSSDPHVKDAIFSDFTTDKSGAIDFSLEATLTPSLVANSSNVLVGQQAAAAPVPAAATTSPAVAVPPSVPATTTQAAATTTSS